jgi:hypothetical protein
MFSRLFILLIISSLLWGGLPSTALSQDDDSSNTGFAKPYDYERQAFGYDPEGIDYKENQAEDFQVVFVSAAPFAGAASFGLTGLASQLFRNRFDVDGDYLIPFIVGTLAGAAAIAAISVLSNKYPPPPASSFFSQASTPMPPLAFRMSVINAEF